MSFSKSFNIFLGKHVKAVANGLLLAGLLWFVGGLILVDILDPWLFIGLWMPIGFIGALICNKW